MVESECGFFALGFGVGLRGDVGVVLFVGRGGGRWVMGGWVWHGRFSFCERGMGLGLGLGV